MPPPTAPTSIREWLDQIGLAQYEQAFASNDVTLALLPSITASDLSDMGIQSVGHRRMLVQHIAQAAHPPATAVLPAVTAAPPTPTAPLSPAPTTPSAQHEHRLVTVMFCDLVGSTELSHRLDAEDLQSLLKAYRMCVTEVIQRHKGFVAQYLGDGVLVYFGYPHISESDCERALRTALDAVRAVQRLSPVAGVKPQVRVGLATGTVVIGQLVGAGATTEVGAVGETPNLAARMQALAAPGGVVVAESTRDAAGDLFEFRSLGPTALKGFAQPVNAWELLSELHTHSRFHATRGRRRLGPLIGRDVELFFLRDRLERARQGRGQAVLLRGEAGTGKSHLVTRLSADAYPDAPPAPVLQCSPDFSLAPLHPFTQYIEATSLIRADDSDTEKRHKLETFAQHYALTEEGDVFVLAEFLGLHALSAQALQALSANELRNRTLGVLLRWLHSLLRERKLLVVEDLHWADPSTMEILGKFVAELPRQFGMLIATSRPTKDKMLSDGAHVSVVHLDRLPEGDIREIVAALAAPRVLPEALVHEIVQRSEGVPIFATELARAILVRDTVDAKTAINTIPATLNDILLARLDQLEFGRMTVQQAAVLGREFEMSLLVACAKDLMEDSQAAIEELLKAELFVQRSTPNGVILGFDHMLVRDAVYQRMLRADRVRLHAKVAQVLEQQFEHAIVTSPHLLALHYTEAGNLDRAVHFWERAGELAANQLAPQEAVAHYTYALNLLPKMPHTAERDARELRISMAVAGPLIGTRGIGSRKLLKIVDHAHALCTTLPHGEYHVPAHYLKWSAALGSWGLSDLRQLAVSVRDAAAGHSEVDRLLAYRAMGFTHMIYGELAAAQDELESFLRLYNAERHGNATSFRFSSNSHVCSVLLALATTCTLRHAPNEADHWRDQALLYAQRSENHLAICQALIFCGGHVSGFLQRPDHMLRYAAQAHEYATKHRLPIWFPYIDLIVALGHLMGAPSAVNAPQHLYKAKVCVDVLLSQHSAYLTAWVALYARACLEHGHHHEGLLALERIEERTHAGERWMQPETMRLRALLQHAIEPMAIDPVRQALQDALELARAQGSLIFVPDIEMGLSALDAETVSTPTARP